MGVIELDSTNFETEIKKPGKIIIDFFADWCGPCHQMAPILEELSNSKEFQGKLRFGKIDVDANNQLASAYGVMSIPQFFVFNNGEIIDLIVGSQSKPMFEARLKKLF